MSGLQFTTKPISRENRKPPATLNAGIALSALALTLTLFGLTMLYSTSSGAGMGEQLFLKQGLWAIIGLAGAAAVYFVGYKRIMQFSYPLVGGSCILLLVALFFPEVKGAHRWIRLPMGINFQPSELAKLALVIFLAKYCADRQRMLNSWRGMGSGLLVSGLVLALILAGKDLGTTILLATSVLIIFFAAGLQIRYFTILIPLMPVFLFIVHKNAERWSRITSFLAPEKYQQDSAYQLWNSLLALGSGSWTGLGFTQSRMKARYLPEAHTDFILSIVGEELGFLCMLAVIGIYLLMAGLGIYISIHARERRAMLLGFGLVILLSLQAIINIGVISGALPTKGMPAPFMSYGGSNLLIAFISIGILLSISAGKDEDIASEKGGRWRRLFQDQD